MDKGTMTMPIIITTINTTNNTNGALGRYDLCGLWFELFCTCSFMSLVMALMLLILMHPLSAFPFRFAC